LDAVDSYIENFPNTVQIILKKIRKLIISEVPEATESIAYGMPAYKFNKKPLIYFAAYNKHIGIYGTPTAHDKFKIELSGYKTGKGSVQFPIDQPIPYKLIKDMTLFKKAEIEGK